jgi:hypothetical protein
MLHVSCQTTAPLTRQESGAVIPLVVYTLVKRVSLKRLTAQSVHRIAITP